MDISKLTFRKFMKHVEQVERDLHERHTMTSLLDAAREDAGIIDEIVRQLVLLRHGASPSAAARDTGELIATRDLVVMLALRSIEQEEREQQKPPQDKVGLRLRHSSN